MRINSINYFSSPAFNGIKVTKKQQESDGRNQSQRRAQKEVLDSWKNQMDLVVFMTDKVDAGSLDAIRTRNNLGENPNKTNFNSGYFTNGKRKFKRVKGEIEALNPSLQSQLENTGKMFEITNSSIDKIKSLDEECINEGSPVYILKSKETGLNRIAGYKQEMDVLNKEFIERVAREKSGEDLGVFGSVLFFGPNSNGKTYITRAVAESSGCPVMKMRIAAFSPDDFKKIMQDINDEALKSQARFNNDRTRTIIFIDEVDKLLGEGAPVTKDFEDFIKSCSEKYHCSVFAATNYPLELGLDMKNPDIFPIKMSIEPPEGVNTEALFKYYLTKRGADTIDYNKLQEVVTARENETNRKFSNGQIENLCNELLMTNAGGAIAQEDLMQAIKNTVPELSEEVLSQFKEDRKSLIEDNSRQLS